MKDTYIQSTSEEAIKAFCKQFVNVLGPKAGLPAFEAVTQTDENGDEYTIPAHEAIGDTSMFYASIRHKYEIELPEGIERSDDGVCNALLGVWA